MRKYILSFLIVSFLMLTGCSSSNSGIVPEDSYSEIVMASEHPVMFGSLNAALEEAKKYAEDYIVVSGYGDDNFEDIGEVYLPDTTLEINGNAKKDIIEDITIYANKYLTDSELLSIIDSYMPSDYKEYYSEPAYSVFLDDSGTSIHCVYYKLEKANDKYSKEVNIAIDYDKENDMTIIEFKNLVIGKYTDEHYSEYGFKKYEWNPVLN